jgi:bile acid-coenzyme A ligase
MSDLPARSAVDQALSAARAADPGRLALVTDPGAPGGTLTRAELDRRSGALADRLCAARRGHAAGSCVVEVGNDNATSTVLLLAAALRTDLPVYLRDQYAADDEQAAVRDELHRAGLSVITARPGDRGDVRFAVQQPGRGRAPAPPRTLPAGALVLASGGTTGRPKLVVDTALRGPSAGDPRLRVTSRLNWAAGQTQLVPGRLHHAAPLTFFVYGLLDANCLIVPRRFAPSVAARLVADHLVNWIQATPVQLHRMLPHLSRAPGALDGLRGVLHMSAPCPPSVKRSLIDLLGPRRVFEIYGATEGIGLTVARGDQWLDRPGTVGQGFLTRLRILDERMAPQPPGEPGIVFMRSMSGARPGYLRDGPGLRVSPDGFRSVGDRGHLDTDNFLFLEPRRVDLINVGGENVYPAEVEQVLTRHPGIAEAAVTALPDQRLGARPVALVTCQPGWELDEREVVAFCQRYLPRFKLPRRVLLTAEIPYTSAGKIDRKRLADMVPPPA